MKCKTIFVTGCDGFIGSSLMSFLNEKAEFDVFGIKLGNNTLNGHIIESDYKDKQWLEHLLKENNDGVLIHTAAYIPSTREEMMSESVLETNNSINYFISEVFYKLNISNAIYFSSIAVYGYGYKDLLQITEEQSIDLRDFYAKSKFEGEKVLTDHFPSVSTLRLTSPYGKQKKNKSILDVMVQKATRNEDIQLFGEGRRTQDFIFIEDICNVIYSIIGRRPETEIFNLASGYECTMLQLANTVKRVFQSSSKIAYINSLETNFVSVNNAKLKNELNISFSDIGSGLRKYKNSLLRN